MKVKAFLKFHRTDPASILCLRFWCELFREHETYILCDHFNPKTDKIPSYLKTVLIDFNVKVINSDYSIGKNYCKNLKGSKRGMASANMTPFQYSDPLGAFWIVDADDTLFLSRDFDMLRDKIKLAETYLFENNIDAFSLDFYRNLNNAWTFGLALLRSSMNWEQIKELTEEEISSTGLARNIDTAFEILGRKNLIKIANFVFNRVAFQHQCNNYPDMPHGIYSWSGNNLWNLPLQKDVIII